ncbi:MAG: EcoRV family type II restriction endonuclease [Armatimonadota bacterium]|nr:EcoRV family type II restriction endonuclease [Armatimonadota bacterium]
MISEGGDTLIISHEAARSFLTLLQAEAATFNQLVTTETGDWVVKGFIDVFKNVYTISGDTKVVSKLIELMLFPHFVAFAAKHRFKLILSREQNHYPDLTFIAEDGCKFAVDLKSTYRISANMVNTMTLGAFTGYFRNRTSSKNVTFPYGEYSGHFVLGVIYSRAKVRPDELRIHTVDEIRDIPSVVRDLQFFAQPKYRIAKDQPGSGNTKNIGAVGTVAALVNGTGPFADLGKEIFDDYWMYYMTLDMARAVELAKPPYNNLATYLEYKKAPTEMK